MMIHQTDKQHEEWEVAYFTSEVSMPIKRAICDLETGVNRRLEESDHSHPTSYIYSPL